MPRIGPGGPFLGQQPGGVDAVSSAPFSQGDWPNPSRRKATGETTIAANLLLSLLAVAVSTAVLRPPTIQRIEPRVVHQVAPVPNLLLSTLDVQPAAPKPFAQTEWPLPVGAQPAVELRTWIDSLKINLLVPFAQRDWPLSRAVTVALPSDPLNLLTTTLAPVIAAPVPFAQRDWPLPRTVATVLQGVEQNLLTGPLVSRDAPFAQRDWPLSRGATTVIQSDPINRLVLAPVVVSVPFKQTEWSLPVGRVFDADLYTFVDLPQRAPAPFVAKTVFLDLETGHFRQESLEVLVIGTSDFVFDLETGQLRLKLKNKYLIPL